MVDHKHTPSAPTKQGAVKDTYPSKSPSHPPQNPPKDNPPQQGQQRPAAPKGDEHRDPVLGTVDPLVRETETLPVEAHPGKKDEPVGHARHAETPEEVEKISAMEGFGSEKSDRKVPPPGSRHYVAGQPVNDEEWEKTEAEANRLAAAGRAQRNEAEKRMAENTPGDPDYHPADPDKRDTDQALGRDPNKRGASDQPGQTNPFPQGQGNADKTKNR